MCNTWYLHTVICALQTCLTAHTFIYGDFEAAGNTAAALLSPCGVPVAMRTNSVPEAAVRAVRRALASSAKYASLHSSTDYYSQTIYDTPNM